MERYERRREKRIDPNALKLTPKQYARLLHIIAELEVFSQIDPSGTCEKAARRLNKKAKGAIVRWKINNEDG